MRRKIFVALFITLVSFVVVCAQLGTAADSGLVLYYKFNNQASYGESVNTVYDFSGRGHNAQVYGASWQSNGGKYGDGAFVFDGKNDKIVIPDNLDLSVATTGEFTIAMWTRFDRTTFTGEGYQRNYLHFLGKGGNGGDYEWMWRQHNASNREGRPNRISFYIFNLKGGLGTGSYFEDKIYLGEWMFITGVVRGKNVEIWKNGVRRDVDPLSNYNVVPRDGGAPANIGTSDGDSYFKGSADELRIYNRALSATEILALYKLDPRKLVDNGDLISSSSWISRPIPLETGRFKVSFNATPLNSNMDGVFGLSLGNGNEYTDLAAIVRFSDTGVIDVRDGGNYRADTQISYTAGTKYQFRMVVDVPNKRYDVFATVNGVEKQIANDYDFRTEQQGTGSLDNYAITSQTGSYIVSKVLVQSI